MGLLVFTIFFLFIGLALSPGYQCVKITKGINGNEWGDFGMSAFSQFNWQLEPNQIVPIYSRNYDDRHIFAFIARNPSQTTVKVVKATLFSTEDDQKICEEDFSDPDGGEPIFQKLWIVDRNNIEVQYTSEEYQSDGSGWIADINTSECATPEIAKAPVPSTIHPKNQENWNSTHHLVNASYTAADILEPAEMNSTQGFVYVRDNNEADQSTRIMFVNSAINETTVLGVIQEAASNKQKRESHANNKYGLCMMEDIDIICVQRSFAGRTIMNYTHLELPKKADWFTVHNLKAKAMLVATGDCPKDMCSEFKVRKIEQGDKISKEISIRGLNIHCPSSGLDMFVSDATGYSSICLNFMCTGKDYLGRKVFQYRRHCFKRSYFESN